jgi:hypothetical protein
MRTDDIAKNYQDDLLFFTYHYVKENQSSFSTVKELIDSMNDVGDLGYFKNWYLAECGTDFPKFTKTQAKIGLGNLLNKKSIKMLLKKFGK